MAEIGGMLAASALKMAAGKIAEAAGDRIMLQWRFGEDLEDMEDTVESIQAVLEDAEGQSITNASVRLWLKRLTRASNDISDIFDEFEVNKTRKSTLRKLKVLNPCLKVAPEVGMASKMKKVREKLDKISNHHHKFSFMAGNSSNVQQVIEERATSSEVIEANIVGRDKEKQNVMELLMTLSTSRESIILPIYGIGGMGKTTLAQLLFNDTHFKDYKKAWVYVGQTFDLKKIKKSVESQLQMEQGQLSSNTQEPGADTSASQKILIVLDDLWEKSDSNLDNLKGYLNMLGNGHKLHAIVTTRDADIAEKIQTIKAHKIEELSSDMCWDIIKKIAGFKDDEADKEKLEHIGMEIAKKCGGVALAARTLGYTLRSRNYDGWVSIKDSDIWNLSSNYNVPASLILSYSSMLPHLRLCFAYCAVFPKGHKMAKDELIYQWAALGFIKPSDRVSIRQHGENCIKQLLEMSFFQRSKSPSLDEQHDKDVTLFTMHDLVHDLARSIMGDEVLDASEKFNTGGRNCRYAFLADYSKPLDSFVTYPNKIRALHFLGSGEIGHCSVGFSTAKYLRVLDLRHCSLKKLASSIGELKLLRYLNAQGIEDGVIPSCITKLSKLIYLSLRGSSMLLALPESIGGMEDLMYLDLSYCYEIKMLPESFGKLESLVHLDLSRCLGIEMLLESFGKLESLVHLDLSRCSGIKMLPESFGKLESLVHLDLSRCLGIEMLPESFGKLESLVHLNLSWCGIKMLPESFGKLESLVHLDLSWCSEIKMLPESFGKLQSLVHLDLSRCFGIEMLPESFGKLKSLIHLNLSYCLGIELLPESFGKLECLVHLDLSHCSRIKMLPKSFGKLERLVHLDLSNYSGVKGISGALRSLTILKYLNLSWCIEKILSFQGLQEGIGELTELQYLNLSGCFMYIRNLGENSEVNSFLDRISTLSNLEHLDLSNNFGFVTLPDSFCSLRKLHTLDLTNCPFLKKLPRNMHRMDSLRILIMNECGSLDRSTIPINNSLIPLPYFVVRAVEGEHSSNLILLKDVNPSTLEISRLENVKCIEEAQRIELNNKQSLVNLELDWTGGIKGFVEGMELLRELMPPRSLERFVLRGYNSVSFPKWPMNIATYLPNLVNVTLEGLPQCSSLPPLGKLRNLKCLILRDLPSITKIDRYLCGDVTESFIGLKELTISDMENLEEWSTSYSCGEGVADKFMFPDLDELFMSKCRKLRVKPCPPRVNCRWTVKDSDGVLLQWEEGVPGTVCSTSPALVHTLDIADCMAPMHQWKLLCRLRGLTMLIIRRCNNLSSSQQLQELPHWLGGLTSLKKLCIANCEGIMSFPESIKLLTNLERLEVWGCPELRKWCELEENKTRFDHIKEIYFKSGRLQEEVVDHEHRAKMNCAYFMRLRK